MDTLSDILTMLKPRSDLRGFTAGDCNMLPRGRPFRLANDLSLTPVAAETVLSTFRDWMATCNGGGGLVIVGTVFVFTGKPVDILLGILPALVHVPRESNQEGLRASLDLLMQEVRKRKPGFVALRARR